MTLLGVGTRVNHPAFGQGVVTKLHAVAYDVVFMQHGNKTVGKDYDKWEIIDHVAAEESITFTEAEKSLAISNQLQSKQGLVTSLYNVAYANYFNGNNKEALKKINEALVFATADSLRDELKNCYTVLSYVASKDGDPVDSNTSSSLNCT